MAGLGLMNALQGYQQGVDWKAQQDAKAITQEADKAYGAEHAAAQEAWVRSNAPGTYKPSDETEFKAAEARGAALAKGGDWKGYLQNESLVAAQRMRVRKNAVTQFEQDGDAEGLVRKVYPTIFDGRQVTGTEKIQGSDAVAGLPARPDSIKVTFSDGKTETKPVAEMVARLKGSLVDPSVTAENEIKANLLRTKATIEGEQTRETERVKGEEARKTEVLKGDRSVRVEEVKGSIQRGLQDVKLGAEATQGAADRASAEKRTGISAAATKYSADKHVEGSKYAADKAATTKADKAVTDDHIMDALTRRYGSASNGLMGGSRMADETVVGLAPKVRELLDANPGMDLTTAIETTAKFHKVKVPKSGLSSAD